MQSLISLLLLFSLFFSIVAPLAQAKTSEKGVNKVFTIGVISTKPRKRIKQTTPLLRYIVSKLPEYSRGEILVTESINEMADMLESGNISMVAVTPYAALLIERQSEAKLAAVRWKQGVGHYHSVIFSRKGSGIKKVADLVGRKIAFEKASSTSGFFMPSTYLLSKGFKLQKMKSMADIPDIDKIGYFFINDFLRQSNEINMSIGVFLKRFDSASFSNLDWADPSVTPLKAKANLQIISETPAYPRSIILTSPTLSTSTEKDLLNTLFNANKNTEGVNAMFKFKKTSQFVPISESELALLAELRLQLLNNFWLFNNAG